jgi:two-component system OmpR family sensor kinase
MTDSRTFAELAGVACHDLRTPLATVVGFARTLARLDLEAPASKYVEMIDAASGQIEDLLEHLAIVARIEAGRYDPRLEEIDSLELARAAADELEDSRVAVSGEGGRVRVDVAATQRALAQLARAAARHGGHDSVTMAVRGAELEVAPLTRSAAPVVLGEDLRELAAPASAIVIRTLGGSLEVRDERLLIRLPSGS